MVRIFEVVKRTYRAAFNHFMLLIDLHSRTSVIKIINQMCSFMVSRCPSDKKIYVLRL